MEISLISLQWRVPTVDKVIDSQKLPYLAKMNTILLLKSCYIMEYLSYCSYILVVKSKYLQVPRHQSVCILDIVAVIVLTVVGV